MKKKKYYNMDKDVVARYVRGEIPFAVLNDAAGGLPQEDGAFFNCGGWRVSLADWRSAFGHMAEHEENCAAQLSLWCWVMFGLLADAIGVPAMLGADGMKMDDVQLWHEPDDVFAWDECELAEEIFIALNDFAEELQELCECGGKPAEMNGEAAELVRDLAERIDLLPENAEKPISKRQLTPLQIETFMEAQDEESLACADDEKMEIYNRYKDGDF